MSAALIRAAKAGDFSKVCRLLDAGVDPDGRDDDGQSALHWAVRGDHSLACLALLHAGADVMARDAKGRTPLHHCAGYGAYRSARALVGQGGWRLDVNARDERGRTAMHACAMTDRVADERMVVHTALGRVDLSIRDNEGFTARERAEQQGKEGLAVSLRAYESVQQGRGLSVVPPERKPAPTGPVPERPARPEEGEASAKELPAGRPSKPAPAAGEVEVEVTPPDIDVPPLSEEPPAPPPPALPSSEEEQLSMF